MEDYQHIDIRSEEVQEILGTPPAWIVRWGTTVTLLAIACIGLVGWMIRIPEMITGEVSIKSTSEPIKITPENDLRNFSLLVSHGDTVKAGNWIAYIGDEADPAQIMRLEQIIDTLKTKELEQILTFKPKKDLRLGELQPSFDRFMLLFENFQNDLKEGPDRKKLVQKRREIETINKSIYLEEQRLINRNSKLRALEQLMPAIEEQFLTQEISKEEYVKEKNRKLDLEDEIKNIQIGLNRKKQQVQDLQDEIYTFKQEASKEDKDQLLDLKTSMEVLSREIKIWKEKHLVPSPVDGFVTVSENKRFSNLNNAKDEILSVVPLQRTGDGYIAEVDLPVTGSGKIKEGQRAIIKLEEYPAEEFGFIEGVVKSKPSYSDSPDQLRLELSLPNGLTTSKGEPIQYEFSMQGSTEIIIEDKRFLERLFDDFIALISDY